MLEMDGVRFGYRRERLFESLDFQVKPGGIVGLLGKNGAGKTTLLKLGAGLLFPQAGGISLFGADPARRRPEVLARIAYVPEQFEVPSMRLRDFMKTGSAYYPAFSTERFEEHLTRFEVSGNDRLPQLSHGQQKKVLICFALATGAELVILDEPTNGLDIPSKQVFRRLAAEAAGDERALIISTHQVRDVENLIDPVVVLEGGRVVFSEAMGVVQDGVTMRRFESELEAERAGALAMQAQLGSAVALVPHGVEGGEVAGSAIDLELLFEAAVRRPQELAAACGGVA